MEESNSLPNFPFPKLPKDVLLVLFEFLDYKDLCRVCKVCRFFRAIVQGNENLWKWIFLKHFESSGISFVQTQLMSYLSLLLFLAHDKLVKKWKERFVTTLNQKWARSQGYDFTSTFAHNNTHTNGNFNWVNF